MRRTDKCGFLVLRDERDVVLASYRIRGLMSAAERNIEEGTVIHLEGMKPLVVKAVYSGKRYFSIFAT